MLIYPEIDPIAFHLGPLAVHWYGLMYLLGFFGGWSLLAWRIKRGVSRGFTFENLSDILFYTALGVIVGGRVGYMVFYAWPDLWDNPLLLFQLWKGGMSFHGGVIGVVFALWYCGRKMGKSLGEVGDFIIPVIPIGLAAGRLGNFINSELWGHVTDLPWGMIFPNGGPMPRHPSQLYELFLEGVVSFSILWIFSKQPRPRYAVSGLFLILYGVFRCLVEFVREPDPQMGFIAFGWMTTGQLLSIPMIIIGALMMAWAYWSAKRCDNI